MPTPLPPRALVALLLLVLVSVSPGAGPPHILFFIIDDLRPELGCYGREHMKTPNIDRLADRGVLFERAFVQVPVCGASRASMMTGLYPTPERFVNYYSHAMKDAPGIADLPGWLKSKGYVTHSNGKVYHHKDDNTASWDDILQLKDFRVYLNPENQGREFNEQVSFEDADVDDFAYPAGALTRKVIADLKKAKRSDKPHFITAGFTKPHLPFNAPRRYWNLYPEKGRVMADNPFAPEDAPPNAFHNWGELRGYGDIPDEGPLPDGMAETLTRGYYACVSYTDAMIGLVLDELEKLEMEDETIVLLVGDHGWQLGEHNLWCKHSLFNTSLWTPMIISAPGFRRGTRARGLVEFVDLYPTLCELSDVEPPAHLQGRSLVPMLKDPATPGRPAVFGRYHGGEAVVTDTHLYAEWDEGLTSMLYDHRSDPDENRNISNEAGQKELVTKMKELRKKHNSTYYGP